MAFRLGFEDSLSSGRQADCGGTRSLIQDHVDFPRQSDPSLVFAGDERRAVNRPRYPTISVALMMLMTIYGFSDNLTSPVGDRPPILVSITT
jgi:hypothetical protein